MGLRIFLRELGYNMTACLKEDASAKHVEIRHFALHHWVRQRRLTLDKVTTTEQLADIMTKPCSFQTLSTLAPDKIYHRSLKLEDSSGWIRDARKALTSNSSMIICDGMFSVEDLTSVQYFASGRCRF